MVVDQLAALGPERDPQVIDQRLHRRAGHVPGQGALGRHREQRRLGDDRLEVEAHEGQRLGQLAGVEQIGLAHHEDQTVAAGAQDPLLQELALGCGEDLPGVEQEHHRVGARNVAVGDVRALLVDVVHAGGVDHGDPVGEKRRRHPDVDVGQRIRPVGCRSRLRVLLSLDGEPVGQGANVDRRPGPALAHDLGARHRAVAQVGQDRGGRGDPHRQQRLPQQRIDEGGLAVVELAQHHQREALVVQLGQALLADVARGRGQAGRIAHLRQLEQDRADGGLARGRSGGAHPSTWSSLPTSASHSSLVSPGTSALGFCPITLR